MHLLVCTAVMITLVMIIPVHFPGTVPILQILSFSQEQGFFSPTPGDTDPKHIPLKQPHVALQSNWHVFLWLGINHTGFSNPGSWQAAAVAT